MTITGNTASIDVDKYMTAAIRINKKVVKKAAAEAIVATAKEIPVDSGEAKASLLNAAQALGKHFAISPLKRKSRIAEGQAQGTFSLKETRDEVRFNFRSGVKHLEVLDVNKGNSPTSPWYAFANGRKVGLDYLKKNAKLPNIKKFMINVRHRS